MPEKYIIRIAMIGPESTGKSHTCKFLAERFRTAWVREYAREYFDKNGPRYSPEDIITIYKEQLRHELDMAQESNDLMFIDTEFINAKIWFEHLTGVPDHWINNMITKHPYDHYLLFSPDVPWEPDPLREHPEMRDYFFELYEEQLVRNNFSYDIISGSSDSRLKNAEESVVRFLRTNAPQVIPEHSRES